MLVALAITARTHTYHQSKLFNSSNRISGSLYKTSDNISNYFSLKDQNEKLRQENNELRMLLFNKTNEDSLSFTTDSIQGMQYSVMSGRIIKNSFSKQQNYITLDIGEKEGVAQDMGVINGQGILGIVVNTSNGYALVQSILNTNSSINAKIKSTNYFGSLVWDGKNYQLVQLIDLPRSVNLAIGDTIVTGSRSSIFPENIPIGTIHKYDLNSAKSFYTVEVELFNDMANLDFAYVIKNADRVEIMDLQSTTENGQ
jgi:rod shape-determining protein MreC